MTITVHTVWLADVRSLTCLKNVPPAPLLSLNTVPVPLGGGVQAANPNPTNTVSVSEVVSGKKIIKVPGCPPIPEVMTGVIMHYALFGEIPPLDVEGRPKSILWQPHSRYMLSSSVL